MRLIITADWHLRSDLPQCRVDPDWLGTQKEVIDLIFWYAKDKQAKLCIVGDLFHRGRDNSEVAYMFIDIMNKYKDVEVYLLGGNHDFLFHNVNNIDKSLFGIIWQFERVKPLWEIGMAKHFGEEDFRNKESEYLFLHAFVWKDKKRFNKGFTVDELRKLYLDKKYIFLGDNHHKFVKKNVINPGCIIIQSVDFLDYQPSVYFFNNGKIEELKLPRFEKYLRIDDVNETKEREDRIDKFIDELQRTKELSFDFVSNLEYNLNFLKDKKLVRYIKNLMEGAKI